MTDDPNIRAFIEIFHSCVIAQLCMFERNIFNRMTQKNGATELFTLWVWNIYQHIEARMKWTIFYRRNLSHHKNTCTFMMSFQRVFPSSQWDFVSEGNCLASSRTQATT